LALGKGRFSGPAYDQLVEYTVSGTISYLFATFQENGFPNPSLNKDARTGFLLQQLHQKFKNADPAEKHQKAIPMCVIAKIGKKTLSELSIAISQSPALQFSLPVNLANTSKSRQQSNNEPKSSDSEISDSFEMVNSLTTITRN
jgi:hypothetical protein